MTHEEMTHASLTLREPATWTSAGREEIAAWLRRLAAGIEADTTAYADGFKAKYITTSTE